MLDLLEAGLAGLRLNPAPTQSRDSAAFSSPEALREEMEQGGFTAQELANGLGLPRTAIDDWLAGRTPVPALALSSLQILRRLTLSERRKLQNGLTPQAPKSAPQACPGIHPFSRIEEL